jgi:hypothetical protein
MQIEASRSTPCTATTRLAAALTLLYLRRAPRLLVIRPHALYINLAVRRDYSSPAARTLRRPCRAPRLLISGRARSTSSSPCVATTLLRLHALYVNLVVHRDYSSPGRIGCSDLPRLRCASGCLGTSRSSSRGSSRRSSSTACHRLLRLHRAFGCLGTPRGSSFI